MGIHCEIKIHKPYDETFKQGSTVSGILKYTIKEETVFNKITLSFRGKGYLVVKHKQRENNLYTHRQTENYVDIDYVIHFNQGRDILSVGTYETQFSFTLPQKLPPSLKYSKTTKKHFIQCYIQYYIRIKFEKPGLKFPKKFKKEIPIISVITPRLSTEPTIYGEQTIITQFFSKKKGVVDAKAIIEKSVAVPAEKIKIEYEIKNDTKHTIRGITAKLVEVYTFKIKGKPEIVFAENVNNTILKSTGISIGECKNKTIEITIPSSLHSLENSNVVSRDYFFVMSVDMRDKTYTVLKIPLQIGEEIQESYTNELLPSYWEVMMEQDEFYRRTVSHENSEDSN